MYHRAPVRNRTFDLLSFPIFSLVALHEKQLSKQTQGLTWFVVSLRQNFVVELAVVIRHNGICCAVAFH